MSGLKFLLDTNYILGLLQARPEILADVTERNIRVEQCAYSSITHMELLGYPGMTSAEDRLIRARLETFTHTPLSKAIENKVITLRRSRKIKLPDAIIAATALVEGIELLTLDRHLLSVWSSVWHDES